MYVEPTNVSRRQNEKWSATRQWWENLKLVQEEFNPLADNPGEMEWPEFMILSGQTVILRCGSCPGDGGEQDIDERYEITFQTFIRKMTTTIKHTIGGPLEEHSPPSSPRSFSSSFGCFA
ncbi:MAG: hypothetical protein LBJ92_00570 [Holosporales bacterium]|nr:hypothetical protein [Holosporales bacterium]